MNKTILIPIIFPLEGSGSGQYTIDLAYWLQKRGNDVTILAVSNDSTTLHDEIRSGKNATRDF